MAIQQGPFVGGQQGISLRDMFAAVALLGMTMRSTAGVNPTTAAETAASAYRVADAMMKARGPLV